MTYKPLLPTNIDQLHWVGPDDAALRDTGLIHCVVLPPEAASSQLAPVVVMIHGWAGDESVMWIFKRTIPPDTAIIAPRAPVALEDNGFIWFQHHGDRLRPDPNSMEEAVDKLRQFLQGVAYLYPIDPTRLVLMGFSQGAMMSNAYVLRYPQDVMGVASLAGAMPPLSEDDLQPGRLAGLPVFIAHGNRDAVIPLEAARLAKQNYQVLGASVTYGEYATGHKMNVEAMADLKKWLTGLLNVKDYEITCRN